MSHKLPAEIWERIIEQIPNSELQSAANSLIRLTHLDLTRFLCRHLIINNDHQLKQLLPNTVSTAIHTRSISLLSWRLIDNHLLINLINSVKHISFINLLIGPLFAPDQLEELFFNHKPELRLISLRFNQNVSRRSYEPFLKGAYFDNCLDLLAKWPESPHFHSLSFVQDPPPSYEQKSHLLNQGIAQPIILFRFWCITNLATSPLGRNILRLRLRIPVRNLAVALTNKTSRFESIRVGKKQEFNVPIEPFPRLKFLDLSTSILSSVNNGLAPILRRFPSLQHLLLDRTQLIFPARFEADVERVDDTLRNIGSTVATAGISRVVEVARLWRELHKLILLEIQDERLRDNGFPFAPDDVPPPPATPQQLTSRRRAGRSAYASAPRWKSGSTKTSPLPTTAPVTVVSSSSSSSPSMPLYAQRVPDKVTFVPAPSQLISLCCGTALSEDDSDKAAQQTRAGWAAQFKNGWVDGLAKLASSMKEKVEEHQRALDGWEKKLGRACDEHGSSSHGEEEHARVLASRPVLVMIQDDTPLVPSDPTQDPDDGSRTPTGVFDRFLQLVGCAEISLDELLRLLSSVASSSPPVLCTLCDCVDVGMVVWTPAGAQVSVNLLSHSPRVDTVPPRPAAHDHELRAPADPPSEDPSSTLQRLFRDLRLRPSSSSSSEGLHTGRCAHLVSRRYWDIDQWS